MSGMHFIMFVLQEIVTCAFLDAAGRDFEMALKLSQEQGLALEAKRAKQSIIRLGQCNG